MVLPSVSCCATRQAVDIDNTCVVTACARLVRKTACTETKVGDTARRAYLPHEAQFPELHDEQPLPPPLEKPLSPEKPESLEPAQLKEEKSRRGAAAPHAGHFRSAPPWPKDWRTSNRLPHRSH